jgi:hydrogenase expression/formation protein HypC
MCLAIPGKIVAIKKNVAYIDYGDQKTEAGIVDGDFKVGDFVIVQGKIVIEKVPKSQIKKWLQFLKESGGKLSGK